MEREYTPGPWGFTGEPNGYNVWQTARECGAHPQKIASITGRHPVEEEEANTRLIAAAPDLLGALRALLREHEEMNSELHKIGKGRPWDSSDPFCAADLARCAIANATDGKMPPYREGLS